MWARFTRSLESLSGRRARRPLLWAAAAAAVGTLAGLRESMRRDGVDVSVVLNIATSPHQMKKVNDFARDMCAGDIVEALPKALGAHA